MTWTKNWRMAFLNPQRILSGEGTTNMRDNKKLRILNDLDKLEV